MDKLSKIATSICVAMTSVLILYELPNYIFTSAMTEHEVSTLSKAIFIPLFIIGTIISALLTHKKDDTKIANIGLLFMGAFLIVLVFFNVYNLQMLLPLIKTNSICTVVMWIARGIGGLIGLFCGFAFGAILTNGYLQYILFVLSAVVMYLLGLLAPDKISYELLFYVTSVMIFITELVNVYRKKSVKE